MKSSSEGYRLRFQYELLEILLGRNRKTIRQDMRRKGYDNDGAGMAQYVRDVSELSSRGFGSSKVKLSRDELSGLKDRDSNKDNVLDKFRCKYGNKIRMATRKPGMSEVSYVDVE